MEALIDELGDRDNLTEGVDAVLPWNPSLRVLEHPFESHFTVIEMANEHAAVYLCVEIEGLSLEGDTYGNYFGVLFRFKFIGDRSGALGLLCTRDNGNWRIVSYESFAP